MTESSVTTLTSQQECLQAVEQLSTSIEYEIALFTQELEPSLYNHEAFCDSISQLARANRHTRIRILAQQTRSVATDGHCLIRLAQRLSSSIQIRIPATPELQHFTESWFIADDHSFMRLKEPERYAGTLLLANRMEVKKQLEFFNHAWENSDVDQHTRRLSL